MNSFRSLVLPLRLRDRYGLWSAAIAALCKWRLRTSLCKVPDCEKPTLGPEAASTDHHQLIRRYHVREATTFMLSCDKATLE